MRARPGPLGASPAVLVVAAFMLCGCAGVTPSPEIALDSNPLDLTTPIAELTREAIAHRTVRWRAVENGPLLIAEHRPDALTFHAGVWMRSGSLSDPRGKGGLAHLVEHLIFRNASDKNLNAIFSGHSNAFTTTNFTYFFCTGAGGRDWEKMDVLLKVLFDLEFTRRGVAEEKRVIKREMAHWEADPLVVVLKSVMGEIDAPEDLADVVIGSAQSLDAISPEDVGAYYRRHYSASDAVIFFTGDLTRLASSLAQGRKLHAKTFPGEPAVTPAPAAPFPSRLPRELRFKTLVDEVYAGMIVLTGGWGRTRPEDLAIADQLLANGLNGLLVVRLLEFYQVTNNIFLPGDLGLPFPLSFPEYGVTGAAVIAPRDTGPVVRVALERTLKALASGWVPDDDLRAAACEAWLGEQLRLEEPALRGVFYVSEYLAGRQRTIDQYLNAIAGADVGQTRRMAERLFSDGHATALVVEPARGIERLTAILRFFFLGRL